MPNQFFPAMQLQGADLGQFGRGLAQGQQLRAQQEGMRMREQQFQQQQQAQGVQNLAGLMSGVESVGQANVIVQNAINSGQLSGPAAELATQKLAQYAQLDPTSAEAMFKADVAGLQAQAYGQSLAGANRVQSSTYVPGYGFVGLTRGGQTISRELTPEQREAMKQAQLAQSGTEATGAGMKTEATEEAKTKSLLKREESLKSEQLKLQKMQGEVAKQKADAAAANMKKEAQDLELQSSFELSNELANSDLDLIFGRGESLYPELFRSQKGIDLMAKKEKYIAGLQLAAAAKMKGSGQISDGERKILANSATILSNPNISPEAAREEIVKSQAIFNKYGLSTGVLRDGKTPDKQPQTGTIDLTTVSDEELFNFKD